jgi:hypothetical protein
VVLDGGDGWTLAVERGVVVAGGNVVRYAEAWVPTICI